jgi:serine protease Do
MQRKYGQVVPAAVGLLLVWLLPAGAGVPPGAVALQEALTQVTDKILPAVVNIESEIDPGSRSDSRKDMDEWLKRFPFPFQVPPQQQRREPEVATGTGLVVRADGYILTNAHVVKDADKVRVVFGAEEDNPEEYVGQVVGKDPESDLAVIKIDKTGLPVAEFGDSDQAKIGSLVIAIGSPFRFYHSVSLGIVSAKGRYLRNPDGTRSFQDYLQTDASINMGNSGGPLVNLEGKVIGINTIIYSPTGGNVGLGFSVPSNTVLKVLPFLIEGKKLVRGFLGVGFVPLTKELADYYGIQDGFQVESVQPGGAADKAGVVPGDTILSFDGKKPKDSEEFRRMVGEAGTKQDVPVVVFRRGKEVTLAVDLGERPAGDGEEPTAAEAKQLLGMTVLELNDEHRKQLELDDDVKGLLLTNVERDSDADNAKPPVQSGTVVVGMDKPDGDFVAIENMDQYQKVLGKLKPGDKLALVVVTPQGHQRRHVVTVSEKK